MIVALVTTFICLSDFAIYLLDLGTRKKEHGSMAAWSTRTQRDDYDHDILLYYHFFDGHDRDDATLVGVHLGVWILDWDRYHFCFGGGACE
jgi:hypothetical protein